MFQMDKVNAALYHLNNNQEMVHSFIEHYLKNAIRYKV